MSEQVKVGKSDVRSEVSAEEFGLLGRRKTIGSAISKRARRAVAAISAVGALFAGPAAAADGIPAISIGRGWTLSPVETMQEAVADQALPGVTVLDAAAGRDRRNRVLGVALRQILVPNRLELGAEFAVKSAPAVAAVAGRRSAIPEIDKKLNALSVFVRYRLSGEGWLRFDYRYEHMTNRDPSRQIPGAAPLGNLGGGSDLPERAQTVGISAVFSFR